MRPWKDFLIQWVMVFLIGALGVTMCYRYVDIPLARFAHQHDLRQVPIFHALQGKCSLTAGGNNQAAAAWRIKSVSGGIVF